MFHTHFEDIFESHIPKDSIATMPTLKVIDVLDAEQYLSQLLFSQDTISQLALHNDIRLVQSQGFVQSPAELDRSCHEEDDDDLIMESEGESYEVKQEEEEDMYKWENHAVDETVMPTTVKKSQVRRDSHPSCSTIGRSPVALLYTPLHFDSCRRENEDYITTIGRDRLRQDINDLFSMISAGRLTQSLERLSLPSSQQLNRDLNLRDSFSGDDPVGFSNESLNHLEYESSKNNNSLTDQASNDETSFTVSEKEIFTNNITQFDGDQIQEAVLDFAGSHFSPMTFSDPMEDDDIECSSSDATKTSIISDPFLEEVVPPPLILRKSDSVLSINFTDFTQPQETSAKRHSSSHINLTVLTADVDQPLLFDSSQKQVIHEGKQQTLLPPAAEIIVDRDQSFQGEILGVSQRRISMTNDIISNDDHITPLHSRKSFKLLNGSATSIDKQIQTKKDISFNDSIQEFTQSSMMQNAQIQDDKNRSFEDSPDYWLDKLRQNSLRSVATIPFQVSRSGRHTSRQKSNVRKNVLTLSRK